MRNATEVKSRPIPFQGEMATAIPEDRKTKTRRTRGLDKINENPDAWVQKEYISNHPREFYVLFNAKSGTKGLWIKCPYGKPGDQLWVRETWARPYTIGADDKEYFLYDASDRATIETLKIKRRPSIHMPRISSRIQLEIVSIRVERLQDISEEDAIAEGCVQAFENPGENTPWTAKTHFMVLWDKINGERHWGAYASERNPWVWVIEFKRLKP